MAIISRRFAETLMPGLDPIGRELLRNTPPTLTWEIVGIVDDASDVTAAEQAEPTLYLPWAQNNNFGVPVAFVIRTAVEPSSLIPAVREALKRVDASLPLRKPQPLDVFVTESTAPERFRMFVLSILAMLGLVLAALGIAGVTYRSVIDRTKDFAVRLALGAEPGAVIRLVLRESIRDLSIGVVAGLAARRGGVRIAGAHAGERRARWTRSRRPLPSRSSSRPAWPRRSCRRCASCACSRRACCEANGGASSMIGLLGGLGVGAAIHYYRELAAAHDDVRRPMQLAMVHASISRATNYASLGDRKGLAAYLAGFLAQLKAAGATIGVLPAVTPHLCIDELTAIAPIPVIDLTKVVSDHLRNANSRRSRCSEHDSSLNRTCTAGFTASRWCGRASRN